MSVFIKITKILILLAVFIYPLTSFGAMLLQVRDTLSSSAPGEFVNHTVEFVTNNSISAGGEIEIEMEQGYFYIPTSFNYEELDILVRLSTEENFVSRELGESVTGTTSAVSVDSGSFGSVVITLAEALPAESEVKILLGTNAENGTQGQIGIRNPTVPRSYVFFLETRDELNQQIDNAKGMVAIVDPVTMELDFDLNLPIRSNGLPVGELPGDTEKVTISLNTDIFSVCHYSTESGVDYEDMPYVFSEDHRTLHSSVIDNLESEQEYTFYVRCANIMGDSNPDDYIISFSVASAPTDDAEPGDPDDEEPEDGGGTGDSSGSGGGSGGGSGADFGSGDGDQYPLQTGTLIIEGWGYPNSDLFLLQDGVIVSELRITDPYFSETIKDIEYGGFTFSVYMDDSLGIRSASRHSTMTIRSNTTNRISNIFLPPTVSPKGARVEPGEILNFFGSAYPDSVVRYEVLKNSTVVKSGSRQSLNDGLWDLALNTDRLSVGSYILKVKTVLTEIDRQSDWEEVTFGVGVNPEDSWLSADLNKDGRVNLADFSILLFHWGTSSLLADINKDGKVGLPDFSIMLFQWTG
jgi:hypothetical protein